MHLWGKEMSCEVICLSFTAQAVTAVTALGRSKPPNEMSPFSLRYRRKVAVLESLLHFLIFDTEID